VCGTVTHLAVHSKRFAKARRRWSWRVRGCGGGRGGKVQRAAFCARGRRPFTRSGRLPARLHGLTGSRCSPRSDPTRGPAEPRRTNRKNRGNRAEAGFVRFVRLLWSVTGLRPRGAGARRSSAGKGGLIAPEGHPRLHPGDAARSWLASRKVSSGRNHPGPSRPNRPISGFLPEPTRSRPGRVRTRCDAKTAGMPRPRAVYEVALRFARLPTGTRGTRITALPFFPDGNLPWAVPSRSSRLL
jgi:hypothetical protein